MKRIIGLVVLLLSATAAFAQYTNTPNIGLKVPIRGSNSWDIPLYYDWTMIDNMLGGQVALPNGLKVTGPVYMPGFTFTSSQIVAGLGYQPLNPANNLSDVNNAATALANLGGLGANSYQGTWSSSTSYSKSALVNYSGIAYISLQAGNVNNEPDTSPTYWGALGGSLPTATAAGQFLASTGAGTTYGIATSAQMLHQLVPQTLAQNFSGNKLGSNAALQYAADNGQSERHFFDLRNTTDWDAEGGLAPLFSHGQWSSSGAGASKMVRAFNFGFSQPDYTIQGFLKFSSSGVANFIGVTPTGSAAGSVAANTYSIGFYGGNFVYYNDSAFTTLLAGTSLTAGSFYTVTLAVVTDLARSCPTGIASITPLGGTTASTFILSGCLPNTSNFQVESDSTYDIQFGLRYSAGTNPVPSASTAGGPGYYGQIDIPMSSTAYNAAWPVQTTVASNPAGSQINTYAIVPPTYSFSAQTPWVLYLHGDGQYGSAIFSGNDNTLIQALAYAGYAVVSTDYTSIACWGNAACTQDVGSAIANYAARFNLAPHPYVIAESMGGLVALNSVFVGTLTPRAIIGLYPVYSLSSMYAAGSGTYASQIQTAYNFTSPSGYAAATAGYDPAVDPISTFYNIPIDIWCSTADTVVSCASNGEALVNAVNAAGGSATWNASSGTHGDPSNFNPAAVVEFFNAH